jgi:putative ABC transport system permease protein
MKMEIARNLWRRKLRTTLTVTGIVMGIFALMKVGATIALPVRPPDAQANFVNQRFTVVGGVGGFLLGFALTALLDAGDASGGLFLVTPRLTVLAIGFAVALGARAGLLPAIRAARMDPVRALRAQ